MDLYELFNTPIDELVERGIIEDRIEQDVKQNVLTFECCLCHDEYTNTWGRGNPDKTSRGLWCTACKLPTMFLKQAVASTVYYRSYTMEHGNLGEDTRGTCWKCGTTEGLHTIKLSNGQEIEVCSLHFRSFVKETYLTVQRKQAILAGRFNNVRASRVFDPAKNYTFDELNIACVDAGYIARRRGQEIRILAQDDSVPYTNDQAGINNAMEDVLHDLQIMQERYDSDE